MKVRDCRGLTFVIPSATLWNGKEYVETFPEPGGSWCYGDWIFSDSEHATWAIIDYASYGDYSGSIIERSNYNGLLDEYKDILVDVTGGYGTRALLINADYADEVDETGRETTCLVSDLDKLADYPIYNEDEFSSLEITIIDEAWDQWLCSEVRHDLEKLTHEKNEEHLTECILANNVVDRWQGLLNVDDLDMDKIADRYWELTWEQNEFPYCESSTDAVFPCHDEIVKIIFNELIGKINE